MADTNEEVFKLLIQTEGADLLPKLQAQLAATNEAFGGLAAAFGRGEVDEKQFAAQSKDLADTHRNLAKAIKDVEDASGKGSSKLAGFGQSALQSGRVIQDFAQGGIGGILNNIEGLTMALGLGPGLAGILTIVGVGFLTLKPQIKEFWDALSGGDSKQILSQFETLSDRIKELKDQPLKFVVDRVELEAAEKQLERLKRGQAEFEAGMRKQTVEQAESGKLVDETLTAAGQPEVEEALRRQYIAKNVASSGPLAEARKKEAEADAEIQAAQDAKKNATTPEDLIGASGALDLANRKRAAAEEEARAIQKAIKDNAPGRIGDIINDARTGNGSSDHNQAAAQDQLARMLDAAGMGGLAGQIRRANPGRLAQIDALNKQGAQEEAAGKIAADAEKARDDAEKKAGAVSFKPRNLALGPAAAGPGKAPKGKIDSDADRRAAAIQQRANQVQDQSAFFTGQQFTAEQSKAAAERSLKLQGQGLNANQATLAAMQETLQAMNGIMTRVERVEQSARGLHGDARQLNQRARERQPSMLNFGK